MKQDLANQQLLGTRIRYRQALTLTPLPLRQEYFVNVLCVQSKYDLLLD